MSANSHVNPELDPFLLQTIIHCFYCFLGDFFSPSVICKFLFVCFYLIFKLPFGTFILNSASFSHGVLMTIVCSCVLAVC